MVYDVKLLIPLKPVTKPRATKASWWVRGRRFMEFRDAFQAIFPRPEEVQKGEHEVGIVFFEFRRSQDLDNLAKAVLDCLGGGFVFPNDSIKYIRRQSYEASGNGKGSGFIIKIRGLQDELEAHVEELPPLQRRSSRAAGGPRNG